MIDSGLVFRRNVASNTVDHRGTVTSNSATANLTHATYTSSWLDLTNFRRGIPSGGMALVLDYAATGFTSTGAAGTAATVWKMEFSDDASAATGPTYTAGTITATFASSAASSVSIPQQGAATTFNLPLHCKFEIPPTRHRYCRIVATTTLGTITAADFGAVAAYLDLPNQYAPDVIDIAG